MPHYGGVPKSQEKNRGGFKSSSNNPFSFHTALQRHKNEKKSGEKGFESPSNNPFSYRIAEVIIPYDTQQKNVFVGEEKQTPPAECWRHALPEGASLAQASGGWAQALARLARAARRVRAEVHNVRWAAGAPGRAGPGSLAFTA